MRVIAGSLRGRALKAPPGDATRPTGAKVKEALFSILGDVSELSVLDLYAGSGALGIEALSRGAASALFVEQARPALSCLRGNIETLGLGARSRILPLRIESALAQVAAAGPFDLVLCDPPWRHVSTALAQLRELARTGAFSARARIVLEHAARDELPAATGPDVLTTYDERRWGDTAVTLLEPAAVPVTGS